MEFLVPSLPEAAYLYSGLALQAQVRGLCKPLPIVLVLLGTLWLLAKGGFQGERHFLARAVGYWLMACVLLVLFWPEAVRFGGGTLRTGADQVVSYAAQQDDRVTQISAEASRLVPAVLPGEAANAPGFALILKALTELHLALGRSIDRQLHRPFAALLPLQWLLEYPPSSEATTALEDWVAQCYRPALAAVYQRTGGTYTSEELLPWGDTPLVTALEALTVTPGAAQSFMGRLQTWLGLGSTPQQLSCGEYLQLVDTQMQSWLSTQPGPGERPLSQVWETEVGMSLEAQSRFILYRALLDLNSPQAPDLTGTFVKLRTFRTGVGTVGEVVQGFSQGGWRGGLLSALTGASHEASRAMEGLLALVGLATWLTWWGPYLVGILNLVLIALFPFAVLWALLPGSGGQPLVAYFAALAWSTSAPLWWGLVDAVARLATLSGTSFLSDPGAWLQGWMAPMVVTAIGVILVPLATALVIFSAYRALGGLWRGGV